MSIAFELAESFGYNIFFFYTEFDIMEAGAYGNLWQTSFSATTESIHRTKMILTSKFYVKSLSFGSSMNLHVMSRILYQSLYLDEARSSK